MMQAKTKRPSLQPQAETGATAQGRRAETVLGLLEGIDRALEQFASGPNGNARLEQRLQEIAFQSQLAALHAALDACQGKCSAKQPHPACRQLEKAAHKVCRKARAAGLAQQCLSDPVRECAGTY